MARNGLAYTRDEVEWLRVHIDDAPFTELARRFNAAFLGRGRTGNGLRCAAKALGIHKTVFRYSDEQIAFLRENRRGRTVQDLTDLFNGRFGMHMSKSSIETQIRNRGIHEESFPIGSETVENGIVFVKVSDTGKTRRDWVQKHRLLYEQTHGKLGKGDVILFLDGNRRNFSLDNLYRVSAGVASNLRVYGWIFKGQRGLQECAIKWCECAEYIKRHFNPRFHMQEWERRI